MPHITIPETVTIRVTRSQLVSALSLIVGVCSQIAGIAHQISPAHAAQIGAVCTVVCALCRSLTGALSGQSAPTGAQTTPPPASGQGAP